MMQYISKKCTFFSNKTLNRANLKIGVFNQYKFIKFAIIKIIQLLNEHKGLKNANVFSCMLMLEFNVISNLFWLQDNKVRLILWISSCSRDCSI